MGPLLAKPVHYIHRKAWNKGGRPSITAKLLDRRMAPWKHNDSSFYEKARSVYACDRRDMFVDTTPTQRALALAIATQPRERRAHTVALEEQLVQMWCDVFEVWLIFALPCALLQAAPGGVSSDVRNNL